MEFQAIAPGQITCSSIERRKYCFLGLQPDKSSDTPTCREKLISYYFLRFKHRLGAIVTRELLENVFISSPRSFEESRETWEKSFRSRRHESVRLFSLLPFSLSFPLFFPLPLTSCTTAGFTRQEIGRPNKANCRTFLVGWRRRRENEGVAVPLRAFACFSAVTLSWQSTGTRCCYRCRGSRASSAPGSSRSSSSSEFLFISRSSLSSNEKYATSNDGYHPALKMDSDKRCIFETKLAELWCRFFRKNLTKVINSYLRRNSRRIL